MYDCSVLHDVYQITYFRLQIYNFHGFQLLVMVTYLFFWYERYETADVYSLLRAFQLI